MTQAKQKTIGYLRVSSIDQDNEKKSRYTCIRS